MFLGSSLGEFEKNLKKAGIDTALYDALFHETNTQPDRGAAILAVSLVEEALTEAIKTKLKLADAVFRAIFEGEEPMVLSGRIAVGRALDLYGAKTERDLHLIRKIRNLFAHRTALANNRCKMETVSFSSPQVSDRCREISVVSWFFKDGWTSPEGPDALKNARNNFLAACALIQFALTMKRADLHLQPSLP